MPLGTVCFFLGGYPGTAGSLEQKEKKAKKSALQKKEFSNTDVNKQNGLPWKKKLSPVRKLHFKCIFIIREWGATQEKIHQFNKLDILLM